MALSRFYRVIEVLTNSASINSSPIAVRVGAEAETFFVHENLLCSNSMFFTKALKKDWQEGEARQVDLPEIDSNVFQVWVKWLYTGRLCYAPAERDDGSDWFLQDCDMWKDVYALGDFLQDSDLKDAAIDAHVESMLEANDYASSLAEWIYPYTNQYSKHRGLAVDLFTKVWSRDDLARTGDRPPEYYSDLYLSYPKDFFRDVTFNMGPYMSTGIRSMTIKDFFRGQDRCLYHDHGSEKPCYKTRPTFTL